ncbi:MAG TPA: GDSL-type esterase/lipase family protein [Oligoflexus sp.]|uniref:GDSL-type esterase/lipase family protein n=1 Tax=Oligoflexus sp. TaxID=1971216 RepID=UPI002D25AE36|nr:GDSL-type esterase/lipase family protein [Oligoflexus sp.]HYX32335.1 GDSL-type esterase/lipase family protein [Oligoflexus sp.]
MHLKMIFSIFTLLIALGPLGCATTSEQKPFTKHPEVNWEKCVQQIPTGPDSPTNPYPRIQDFPWMSRNEWCTRVLRILNDPVRADAKLGFMGDSITQMWPKDLGAEKFSDYKPIWMGIGGDRTQTLLWRMENGELKGLSLETLVLLIGTNNLSAGDSPEEVTKGVNLTIDQIRKYQPQTRIILMAIFPREQSPADPLRIKVRQTNQLLSASAKSWKVDFLDIGPGLVEKDGTISKKIMGDFVHLTPTGYVIWADAVTTALRKQSRG